MIDNKEKETLCWYCRKAPRIEKKDALFCKECEEIETKKVTRAVQENFYDKV